jgi:mannan endo-1,4-beta-mannosidase
MIGGAVGAFTHLGGMYLFVRVVMAAYAVSALGRLIPVHRKQRPGFRRHPGKVAVVSVASALAVGAGCSFLPRVAPGPTPQVPITQAHALQVGVFEPGEWNTFQPVEQFAKDTGRKPGIVLIYSGWSEPFQQDFAAMAYAHNAQPFVQMEPTGASAESIAAGGSDKYLRSYAADVRRYGHPVILSFGAEMNGDWYAWGSGHTSPADYRAAWRHVVTVFRDAGASNVTWLWTVFSNENINAPLSPWWPGAGYVNAVGIDGYYYRPSDTFASVFGTTVSQVRQFTREPILISETSAGQQTRDQPGKINDLFAGVRADKLLGLVWFDEAQHQGFAHQDWRLEDNPAAVAAFRNQLRYQQAEQHETR